MARPGFARCTDRRIALTLFVLSLVVYNANLRVVGTGDSYPARFLPFAIWKAGTLDLEPVLEATVQRHPNPYWVRPTVDGRPASLFPVVTPMLITPLYAPAVAYVAAQDWRQEELERAAVIMEKVSASLVTSLAVALCFVVLRHRLGVRDALLLTLTFAFGTNTWVTSSQALWLHAVAELCGLVALWAMTGEPARWRVLAGGAAVSLLTFNRPPDVFLALGLGACALLWARRRFGFFVLGGLIPGLFFLGYNMTFFAHPVGAWGVSIPGEFFHHPILQGIAGLLFSPGRGLFVYSPVLLFLPLLLHRVWREGATRPFAVCLGAGIVLQILFYARTDWRAGHSYGPRYLVDALPLMIWLMAPVVASLRHLGHASFVALLLMSMMVQYIGAFHYTGSSNFVLFSTRPADTEGFWRPGNAQFLLDGRKPPVPPLLVGVARSLGDPPPPGMLSPPAPERVHHVPSCTALDTRASISDGTLRSHTAPRVFKIVGTCGVPTTAKSVLGLLTASNASSPGRVLIGKHAGERWTSIAIEDPGPVSARVTVPLSAAGMVQAMAAMPERGHVQLRFAIDGYGEAGPHAPLPPSACRVRWSRHTTPATIKAGSTARISVTLTNLGDQTWPDIVWGDPVRRSGANAVRLSHAWSPYGSQVSRKGVSRTDLARPLAAGETATLIVAVTAPSAPGRYRLVFELVQEAVAWLEEQGAEKLVAVVTVT